MVNENPQEDSEKKKEKVDDASKILDEASENPDDKEKVNKNIDEASENEEYDDKVNKGIKKAAEILNNISLNLKEEGEDISKNEKITNGINKAAEILDDVSQNLKKEGENMTNDKDKLNRGINTAEKILDDISRNVKDVHSEFERKYSEYSQTSSQKISLDFVENPFLYCIKVDLPGVSKEAMEIEITENNLKIIAEFPKDCDGEDCEYIKKERNHGHITREIKFKEPIQIDNSTAKLEMGLLTIMLPKIEKESVNLEIK